MDKEFEENFEDYIQGQKSINATSSSISKLRQEVSFSIYLKPKGVVTGLEKQDATFNLILEGRDDPNGQWYSIVNQADHVRTLQCYV